MAGTKMNGAASDYVSLTPKPGRKPRRRKPAEVKKAPREGGVLIFLLNHWRQIGGTITALAAAGWIMLPAKQVDVDALREGLKQTTLQVQAISAEVRGLRQEMGQQSAQTQEMIRVLTQSALQASAPAPAAPARPARARTTRTEAKPVEAGGFLGGFFPK